MSRTAEEWRDRLEAGELPEPEPPAATVGPFSRCNTLAELREAVMLANLCRHVLNPNWRPNP